MSNDLLITPGSRKQEFKDSSGNIDAKIETDASGNLLITNTGGDISIGDTTSDVFIGDGTNNVDIVFEQDGEIRGTSGVTLTLGASGSNVRLATDLNLNSNEITSAGDITSTGIITTADHVKATGNNLKLHAGGVHVLNIDLLRNVYPNTHNSTDLGHSDSLAFRNFHLVGAMTGGADITAGNVTVGGNLIVNGTTTTLNTATLDVEDKNITINYHASNDTSSSADGAGITIQDAVNSTTDATFTWDSTNDKFTFSHGIIIPDRIIHAGDADTYIQFDNNTHRFFAAGEEMLKFNSSLVTINEAAGNNDFRVKGNTVDNLLYVDGSADRVGIKTATPATDLHVAGTSIRVGTSPFADFKPAQLYASSTYHFASGNNTFFHFSNSSNAAQVSMDMANTAVGIGVSAPAERLHVSGGHIRINNGYELRTTDTSGNTKTIARVNTSNQLEYGWSGAGPVKFMGGGSYAEKMRIHTDGNIGIGVPTPTHKLHVGGDIRINNGGALKLYNSAGNGWAEIRYDNATNQIAIQRTLRNGTDHVGDLGTPSFRWGNVYARYSHAYEGFTSDTIARQTVWRAIDNAGNSGTRYVKICRVTGAHSTRFNIELTGRSTSYGDGVLPAFGRLVGQMNNDDNFDLMFYNYHQGSAQVVNGIGQVDIDGVSTDIYVEITSYSEVVAVGVISDGTILPTTGNTGTGQGSSSTPTGYSAVTMQKVIMENVSGNVGIGTTAPNEKLHVAGEIRSTGLNLEVNTSLYNIDRTISYYSASNGVYVNGAGAGGWLRLNASGAENSRNSIDLFGSTGGDYVKIKARNTDTMWIGAGAAGRVGIGTSQPSEKLVVNVNSSGIKPGIIINNQYGYGSGVGVAAASLQFGRDNSPDNGQTIISGQIYSGNENESTSNPCMMAFSTKSGTSPYTLTERMRITSTGNVGIGSTNPQEKLDVADNTDSSARIGRAHIGAVGHADYAAFSHRDQIGGASYALLQSSSGQTFLNAAAGNAINFRIANAGMMVIDSNGRINMGATASSRGDHGSVNPKLYVVQSGTNGAYNLAARFQAGDDNDNTGASILINHSNDRGLLIEAGRQSSDRGIAYFGILNSGGTNSRLMTLWQDGTAYKVGVGETSPSRRLQVTDTATTSGEVLYLRGHSSGGAGIVYSRDDSFTWYSGVGGGSGTGSIPLSYFGIVNKSQGGVALSIAHTTNNVGIGTTAPNALLHVGDTAAEGSAANPAIQIGGATTYRLGMYTTAEGAIIDNANGDDGLQFHTKVKGEAMRILSNGNVGIGITAPTASLHVAKPSVALGSQPSTVAIFDSTGTDGVAQIRVQHLTANTAAALGAGIEFMVGEGTSGSNTKSSYIRQRGAGQFSLDYIADRNHSFYVDHHDNDLTGTGYNDRGTLALDIKESGDLEPKYNLNVLENIKQNGTTIVDTSKRVYTSSALYFNSANNSSQIAVDSTVNLRYMGDGIHIFQTYSGSWGTRAEITDSGLNMASGTDIRHNNTVVLNGSRYIANVDRLYLGSTNNFNGNYLSMDASKLMVNDGCDIQLFNSSDTGNGSVHLPRDGMISFYGNSSLFHSISAQNSDSLRINSYAKVDINLDSNGNDTSADFTIGRHAGASSAFGTSDILFRVFENDGDIVAKADVTAFGSFSDRRLKENIKTIDKPIEKVMTLSGVTFNYRDTGKKSTGLIAQDLEEVLPEAVYETPKIDGKEDEKVKAIRYGNTVGLLVEAIKEQQTIINRLEERINTLEKERE